MKKSIQLFVSCAVLITSLAQAQWSNKAKITGNGTVVSEKRTTSSYNEIAVIGFFDVELVSGNEGNITVKGEENLLPYIKIEVVNQVLKIYSEKNKYFSSSKGKQIIITVPFESINQVSLTGSGDILTKNRIQSKSFSAKLIGSGDMDLEVEADELDANLSGSGDLKLTGTTVNLNSNLNGSGDIDAANLKAKNVTATVSGSGDNTVFCSESLHARVSGSGDIEYKGDPKKKDTKVTGSGNISKS